MKIHYDFGSCGYDYEPDEEDFEKALIKVLCKNVKSINKEIYDEDGAYQMAVYIFKVLKQDLDYDISEIFGEWFEEELREHFYKEALHQYNEDIAKEENDRFYDLNRHN